MITIRRIQIGEADLLKKVRLIALKDAPHAFSTTYDSALQRSAETWREQAERSAQGRDRATFIAFSEDIPIGMVALYRREDKVDVGELLQVWVSRKHRGTSVATDLTDVIFRWAGENNFRTIIAGVTKGNARALQFYKKYGFAILDEFSANDSDGVYLVKDVQNK